MSAKTFSPYAAAKIVNIWLAADGIQKKLPPQMMYQYVSKGYIRSIETEEGSKCKRVISEEALATWYATYTKKTVEAPETIEVTAEDIAGPLEVDGVPIDDEQTVLFATA